MSVLSEHAIQASIVEFLDLVLPADQRIVAIANNPRSRLSGALERARGMKAGVPDLLLLGRVQGLFEVKSEKGRLSPAQVEWRAWAVRHGVNYALVRSIDDVAAALHEWGLQTREGNSFGFETKTSQRKTSEAGDM